MEIKGIGRPWPIQLTPCEKIKDNKSFQEVLQLRISQRSPVSSVPGAGSRAGSLEQGERVLDLLEGFAQALADPQKSLRALEPLALEMEEEVKHLEPTLDSRGNSDQGLARLMSEVSLLTNVALLKFRRGDYI